MNKSFFLLLGMLCGAPGMARSGEVTLYWDPVTAPNADGYRLFHARTSLLDVTTSQAMTDPSITQTVIPSKTTSTLTVNNLSAGNTYYFRLAAFDASGNQSPLNVEADGNPAQVTVYIPPVAEARPPEITVRQKFVSPGVSGSNEVIDFGSDAEEVTICDINGQSLFRASRDDGASIAWNCRDDGGNLAASGVYIAKLKKSDGSTVYQAFVVVK